MLGKERVGLQRREFTSKQSCRLFVADRGAFSYGSLYPACSGLAAFFGFRRPEIIWGSSASAARDADAKGSESSGGLLARSVPFK